MSIQIPCIECTELVDKATAERGRCAVCYKTWEAKRNRSRTHYKGSWKRDSKKIRDRHIRTVGPICPRCNKETDDLTVDHVENRSAAKGFEVLCRSCNSRKQ